MSGKEGHQLQKEEESTPDIIPPPKIESKQLMKINIELYYGGRLERFPMEVKSTTTIASIVEDCMRKYGSGSGRINIKKKLNMHYSFFNQKFYHHSEFFQYK